MSTKYLEYPEYKDSGVEWLGKIPSQWKLCRLKFMAKIKNGQDYKAIQTEVGFPVIGSGGKFTFASEYMYDQESVLLGRKGTIDKPLYINEPFWSVDTMYYTEVNKDIDVKYLYYLALTIQFDRYSTNTALPSMTQEHLGNFTFSVPKNKAEREKIANFLDHETAKIDTLIEKQQQLIKLLKEKRQAVISHAVTKGLNPNVPMRDSGVEWLGEVPVHWEVLAVSKLSQKITNGYVGPTRDILVPIGVPYVQATHIKRGKVNFDDTYYVSQSWSSANKKSILIKGDVLIVQTGAGTGDVGVVTENEEGFNCHALIIIQPTKKIIAGDYLSMVFLSQYGHSILYSIRTGGMHPHLNCGEVQFVKIPVPPRDEQKLIFDYINEQIYKFDTLVEQQLKAIRLMQERRTALISAAVTGKIDVRNWTAPASSKNKEVA